MPQGVEIRDPRETDLESENTRRRQAQFAAQQLVSPRVPRDRLPAIGILGAALYKGGTIADPADITGVAGSRVIGDVTFRNRAIVRLVQFDEEVNIAATATAAFVGCRFLKSIVVAAGGRVTVTAGRYDGTASILNAGAPAAATSAANVKTSVPAHTNTTVIGDV